MSRRDCQRNPLKSSWETYGAFILSTVFKFISLITLAQFSCLLEANQPTKSAEVTYDVFGQVVMTVYDPNIKEEDSSVAMDKFLLEFDPYHRQEISIESDKLLEALSNIRNEANFVLRHTPPEYSFESSEYILADTADDKGYQVCFINKEGSIYVMNQCTKIGGLLMDGVTLEKRNQHILTAARKYFPSVTNWQDEIQVRYDGNGQIELFSFDTLLTPKQVLKVDQQVLRKYIFERKDTEHFTLEQEVILLSELFKSMKGKVNFEFSPSTYVSAVGDESSTEEFGYSLSLTGAGHRFEDKRFSYQLINFFAQNFTKEQRNQLILDALNNAQKQ